jgi:uncharacterized protein YgbK (DUF1537 family)
VIAAVADDFTGAAELGGVGHRHGLSAEVRTSPAGGGAAELTVLDTDSRDGGRDEAREKAAAAARWLRSRRPARAYVKVDSILRGWVRAEVDALLEALEVPRALLVFANPLRGRIVRDARCFVDGRPVHETDFARDPHHPVRSSDVREMLGASGAAPVFVRRWDEDLPPRGIVVGEADSREDVLAWARRIPDDALAAGAAEFFGALLEVGGRPPHAAAAPGAMAHSPTLLVCGSASERGQATLREAAGRGIPVLTMPEALFENDPGALAHGAWADAVADRLRRGRAVAIGVGRAERLERAADLPARLAEVAVRVLRQERVGHLLAEGGATAAALARRAGWSCLAVRGEGAPGVVTLQAPAPAAPRFTVKPGSYPWPPEVWEWMDARAS